MATRFVSFGVAELKRHASSNPNDVPEIILELEANRTTYAATRLVERLRGSVKEIRKPSGESVGSVKSDGRQQGSRRRPANWSSMFDYRATDEQEAAVDLFLVGKSMKISAFAGAGKTSTLKFLAATAPRETGLYLAFNKSIAAEASQSFSNAVDCRTTHSAALRDVGPRYSFWEDKWFNTLSARQLASEWNIERMDVGPAALRRDMIAYLIILAVKRFCQSADPDLTEKHVQLLGRTLGLPPSQQDRLREQIVIQGRRLWQEMISEQSSIPLGHDGYLKLWSLMEPQLPCSYVLLDEAQDTNPAVLSVLKRQKCQVIYVGDKHQQIYEWRGAVNAMDEIGGDGEAHLTTSFRFGPELAAQANRVLRAMGEVKELKGFEGVATKVSSFGAENTVLTRTNAALFAEVLGALAENKRPYVVGGVVQMKALLRDVKSLRNGEPGSQPEFFGFSNWGEVLEFVDKPEGEPLKSFVRLVEKVTVDRLWHAVCSCENNQESTADLVLSTAHKSKGREWDSVRLAPDFLTSQVDSKRIPVAEARVFYVAMTRAKKHLIVDPAMIDAFSENLIQDLVQDKETPSEQPVKAEPRPERASPIIEALRRWTHLGGRRRS